MKLVNLQEELNRVELRLVKLHEDIEAAVREYAKFLFCISVLSIFLILGVPFWRNRKLSSKKTFTREERLRVKVVVEY